MELNVPHTLPKAMERGTNNQNAEKSILIYLVGYFFQEKYSGTNYRCTLSLCLSLNLRWVDLYIGTRKFHVQVYMAWQSAVCLCLIFHIRHEECELYRFQNLWLAIDSILFALVSYSILLPQTRSLSFGYHFSLSCSFSDFLCIRWFSSIFKYEHFSWNNLAILMIFILWLRFAYLFFFVKFSI